MNNSFWDCIVIGAGPAGAHAAFLLAAGGYRVMLLERAAEPGLRNACGGSLVPFLVKRIGLEAIVEHRITKFALSCGLKKKNYAFKTAVGCLMQRQKLDAYLSQKAQKAGVVLCTASEAIDLDSGTGEVFVRQAHQTEPHVVQAKVIICADGPQTIAARLGIGFDRRKHIFAYGLSADIPAGTDEPESAEIHIDPDVLRIGYFWMFPRPASINFGIWGIPQHHHMVFPSLLHNYIEHITGQTLTGCLPIKGGLLPLEPAKEFVSGRVMVIGDAAGLINPFTGGGIHYAMKSAEIAAAVIMQALKNGAPLSRHHNNAFKHNLYYTWLIILHWCISQMLRAGKRCPWRYYQFLQWYARAFAYGQIFIP